MQPWFYLFVLAEFYFGVNFTAIPEAPVLLCAIIMMHIFSLLLSDVR